MKREIIEWLGFDSEVDLTRFRPLGALLGLTFLVIGLLLIFVTINVSIEVIKAGLRIGPYENDVDGSAIRNTGLVLAAILGAPFVVWRSFVAARQAETAAEALFNDKLSTAADDLSAKMEISSSSSSTLGENGIRKITEDLVKRSAAIDRLEGLAIERKDASPRIVRLLASYVRGNFPADSMEPTKSLSMRKTPRMDLQNAIDAIGRIHEIAIETDRSEWRLNLKSCNLDGVLLVNGCFRAADFSGSRFEGAVLRQTNLDGCLLRDTLLNYADFHDANLTGAKLDRCIWTESGNFEYLGTKKVAGLSFIDSDISGLEYLGEPEDIRNTVGNSGTKLPADISFNLPENKEWQTAFRAMHSNRENLLNQKTKDTIKKLNDTGFSSWIPYSSSDLATGMHLRDFYEKLKLSNWPYF